MFRAALITLDYSAARGPLIDCLIVVGKHGQNGVESMTIGSTAANLCEVARRPVLMVPLHNNEV